MPPWDIKGNLEAMIGAVVEECQSVLRGQIPKVKIRINYG